MSWKTRPQHTMTAPTRTFQAAATYPQMDAIHNLPWCCQQQKTWSPFPVRCQATASHKMLACHQPQDVVPLSPTCITLRAIMASWTECHDGCSCPLASLSSYPPLPMSLVTPSARLLAGMQCNHLLFLPAGVSPRRCMFGRQSACCRGSRHTSC